MDRKTPGIEPPAIRDADEDSLPPQPPSANSHGRKVTEITSAVATKPAYFLDITRGRIMRDWLRGVPMHTIRVTYSVKTSDIEAAIREEVRARVDRRAA